MISDVNVKAYQPTTRFKETFGGPAGGDMSDSYSFNSDPPSAINDRARGWMQSFWANYWKSPAVLKSAMMDRAKECRVRKARPVSRKRK